MKKRAATAARFMPSQLLLISAALFAAPVAMLATAVVTAVADESMEQRAEFALLRVVEARVERLRGVGERLEIGGVLGESIRDHAHVVDRRRSLGLIFARLAHRAELIHPVLGDRADGAFEPRPVLFLIGVKIEARLQAGDVSVEQRRALLHPELGMGRRIIGDGIGSIGVRRAGKRGGGDASKQELFHEKPRAVGFHRSKEVDSSRIKVKLHQRNVAGARYVRLASRRERSDDGTIDEGDAASNNEIILKAERAALAKKGSAMSEGGIVGTLSRRIAAGECVFAAWVGINEPMIAEQLARDGFDTAVMEMQHGSVDVTGALRGIAAVALAGKPAIVRIPIGDFATASRVIDAGAAAVIAPMINSAADARAFADFMKFPPLGQRSWGPRAALALTGYEPSDYLRNANQITLAIAMVETRQAIAALDDILATPGIDGVFVGPSDLSIALSDGGAVEAQSQDVDSALTTIVAAARKHGKFAAAFCHTGERAHDLARRGFSLCSVSTDQLLLRLAARQELAKARAGLA